MGKLVPSMVVRKMFIASTIIYIIKLDMIACKPGLRLSLLRTLQLSPSLLTTELLLELSLVDKESVRVTTLWCLLSINCARKLENSSH